MTIRYPGGKSGAGVYQRIINLIPPHRVYVEAFLGGGAILRRKRPADTSIAIDADPAAIELVKSSDPAPAVTYINGDAISFLEGYAWRGDEFVYCDPPYLLSTRKGGALYRHEMTDEQHRELLSVLLTIPAGVMLSGYPSELYNETLAAWHTVDFQAMTRAGRLANERLWLNYRPPALLHDDRYLGDNFRERERIKRKRSRWVRRFEQLPTAEQGAIFRELGDTIRSRTVGDSDAVPIATNGETGSGNAENDEARGSPAVAMVDASIPSPPAENDDAGRHRQRQR